MTLKKSFLVGYLGRLVGQHEKNTYMDHFWFLYDMQKKKKKKR